MESRYTEQMMIVIPVTRQAAGRTAFRTVEQGDPIPGSDSREADLFARGLSAAGSAPATHVCLGPKVTALMLARVAAQIETIPLVRWARVSNPEGLLLSTNSPGAPEPGAEFAWEDFVALLGLKFVEE